MPPSINKAPKKKEERSQAELRTALEQKSLALKSILEAGMAEYEKADTDDEATEKKLLTLVERVEKMRAQLDSGEVLTDTPEADTATIEPFFVETWKAWGIDAKIAGETKQTVEIIPPSSLNFKTLSTDINPKEFGTYTLNPETQGLNLEKLKVFIPDLSKFNGKPLHEVMQHVINTYSATHHIPGIEYWKWLIENPGKSPPNIKDGNYYFFPGSTLRGRDGKWIVPYTYWNGSSFLRRAVWLTFDWYSYYRVVLLER